MTDRPPLFRSEAIAHRTESGGAIILLQPIGLRILSGLALVIFVVLVSFISFAEYTRKVRLTGTLLPIGGLVRLASPGQGTITEQNITDGKFVKAGDPLLVLHAERYTRNTGDPDQAVRQQLLKRQQILREEVQRQQTMAARRHQELSRQIIEMQQEVMHLAEEVETVRSRVKLAETDLARFRELNAAKFISAQQLQQKTDEWLDQKSKLQSAERGYTALKREKGKLEDELAGLGLRSNSQNAQLERDLAEVTQETNEQAARTEMIIRAPRDGIISGILTDVGQTVNLGQPLLQLIPAGTNLEAHLFATSEAIGFIQPGQNVFLRYRAFPYQKFGHQLGQIRSVSRAPVQTNDLPLLSKRTESGSFYQIIVTPKQQNILAYGQTQPLHAGMELEADVQLDRRRLIEWLFEPLFSLTGRT